MKYILILSIFITCIVFSVNAQEKDTITNNIICELPITSWLPPKNHFYTGAGWAKFVSRDLGMSPLIYKGSLPTVYTGFSRVGKNVHQLEGTFQYGEITSEEETSTLDLIRFTADYTYLNFLRNIWRNKIAWYAGGSANDVFAYRQNPGYSNNSLSYENIFSLSVSSALKYRFTIKKRALYANYQLNIPFFGHVVRPSYVASYPDTYMLDEEASVGDAIKGGDFTSWNHFFRLSSKLSLSYPLKNKNTISLGYQWDYYSYNKDNLNPVKAAIHQIFFATGFNF